MYGFGGCEDSRQTRGDRGTVPYVVRELSWELARYLETQDFPESASESPNSAGGHPGWTREEERLAG